MGKEKDESETSFELMPGEHQVHESQWSRAGAVALTIFVAGPLFLIGLFSLGQQPVGPALIFLGLGIIAAALPFMSQQRRRAIVTTRRVVFIRGLTNTTQSVPLEKIEEVSTNSASVSLRAGSALNSLTLNVQDPAQLAAAVERARAANRKPKEMDASGMGPI
ncbi:hypothetical protein [Pelagibacterium mangrovi]|uniref:hypothetical protein n=1 Tax=Pelagibacterium mangrovi TaxID=3119828 RepID=UPI002FCC98DF